jgi:hypothetical protein
MGANKQSRFHGKDPRYKNIERTTLADIAPVEPNGWDSEADQFLADRQLNHFRETRIYGARASWKVAPNPELEDVVKRYLASRNIAPILETEIEHRPERVALETPAHAIDPLQIAPAKHDILLQMFMEKKISAGHFHAGRHWQYNREAATLQPNISIDWSMTSGSPYQNTEMSERQWEAIRRRRQFTQQFGVAAAAMLDFFLEVDRGRADLIELTRMPAVRIETALEELLEKVCECFA